MRVYRRVTPLAPVSNDQPINSRPLHDPLLGKEIFFNNSVVQGQRNGTAMMNPGRLGSGLTPNGTGVLP